MIPSLSASSGGPSTAIAVMERVLAGRGVLVETATTNDDGPHRRNGKSLGVPLAENGVTRRYFSKMVDFYKISPSLALWAMRHVRCYDLVHIHALFSFTSVAVAWAARRAGVPYVLRPLGTLTRYGVTQRRPWLKQISLALLEGRALRRAAAVHFTSEDEQREAAECGIAMRSVVIPLGIEPSDVKSVDLVRSRFPSLGEQPYLLYLSRLDRKKNVESLLRAFSLCSGKVPGVKLLIAGSGDPGYVQGLHTLSWQLGLANSIVWAGQVEGELKASALAGATAFVLPSFSENFGIAAAEALMAGKPCILGTGVALAQEVDRAGAGCAVAPDPESIAGAMVRVLTDAPLCAQMSLNAAALARANYSSEAMGLHLFRLYSEILKR